MKLLLIINPNAGKMSAGACLLEIVTEFAARGYEATVYPTAAKGDAERKVVECGGDYDLIVCYGGDGTLSEVAAGVARRDCSPPFGFVPAGTANDFATTVGMPSDVRAAVQKILNGQSRSVDIGEFNKNSHFIYVAAFGMFTSVSYSTPQDMKKVLGHLSYVVEGIKQAVDIPSYKMAVETDNSIIRGEFAIGLVTNSTSVAGMFRLPRSKVRLDDGEFELVLVRNPENPILLSNIIMDLSANKYDPDYVVFQRVSSVTFTCDEPVAWCLDGENGGLHRKVVIKNLHKKGMIRL